MAAVTRLSTQAPPDVVAYGYPQKMFTTRCITRPYLTYLLDTKALMNEAAGSVTERFLRGHLPN